MDDGKKDRSGHRKELIYCPQIASDTLLHFNVQGTSYALRDFSGTTKASGGPTRLGAPFKATDENGVTITTTAEFERLFRPKWVADVRDHDPLTKVDVWKEYVRAQNEEYGLST